ncbi:restriction endonuclease [Streptomyces sp. NBC_00289]
MFDLRATAMFFTFLAVLLSVVGFAARTAAGVLERRPGWALVLLVVAAAGCLILRHRRRRFSPARAARRAAAALDEASRAAADLLEPSPTTTPTHAWTGVAGAETEARPVTIEDARPGVPEEEGAVADATRVLVPETPVDEAGTALADDDLDPYAFEETVAALCERDGCTEVEVVGGAGDLGADVVAVAPDGRRLVIQCKRYGDGNRVGSQDLQRFGGTCFTVHEADVAVLVTTSEFTAPAVEYAEQCGIVCWDGPAVRAWSDGTGPRPWEQPEESGCTDGTPY